MSLLSCSRAACVAWVLSLGIISLHFLSVLFFSCVGGKTNDRNQNTFWPSLPVYEWHLVGFWNNSLFPKVRGDINYCWRWEARNFYLEIDVGMTLTLPTEQRASSPGQNSQPWLFVRVTRELNAILMNWAAPRPRNHNLWRWNPGISAFKSSPYDSNGHLRMRTL